LSPITPINILSSLSEIQNYDDKGGERRGGVFNDSVIS
jgi:hypothetical protein